MKRAVQILTQAAELTLTVGAAIVIGIVGFNLTQSKKRVLSVQKIADLPAYNQSDILLNSPDKSPGLIRLHTTGKDKGRFFCTAFVISDKYAISAAHCLVDEDSILKTEPIEIRTIENKFTAIEAQAAGVVINSDVGILKGDFSKFAKLPVATTPVEAMAISSPGVVSCGFPLGDSDLCAQFFFSHASEGFFFGRGFLAPGMSGGPVIAQAIGKVVAVNSAMGSSGVYMAPIIGLFSSLEIEVK
jgi:hypothetical protein